MFVEVKNTDMVVGVKYAIVEVDNLVRYYTGTFRCCQRGCANTFHYMKPHYYIENTDLYNEIQGTQYKSQYTGKAFYCFAFVPKKEKIQQAMEQRALNKILKRLVNEEFQW